MKTYRGIIESNDDHIVTVDNGGHHKPLPPRNDLFNHSPDGFAWGYGGSGPAQLALAILADHFSNDELALKHYQQFKFRVIAQLDMHKPFKLTSAEIDRALTDMGVIA